MRRNTKIDGKITDGHCQPGKTVWGIIFSFHHKNFIFKPIKLATGCMRNTLSKVLYSYRHKPESVLGRLSFNMGIGNRPDTILVYVFFLFYCSILYSYSDDSNKNHRHWPKTIGPDLIGVFSRRRGTRFELRWKLQKARGTGRLAGVAHLRATVNSS
jgi:hypothetical protein